MADWLHETTKIPVKIAENGMKLEEGIVYLAPDVCDIGISKNLMVELNHQSNADNGVHPSVGYLFHSIAQNFKNQAMGILLTGMGQDGAKELKVLKDKGAITISQDEASSIVYGMPKAAKELDAALYTLSPKEIALMINRIKDEN
jgi:two-component system chemotaxis response regulator CheB